MCKFWRKFCKIEKKNHHFPELSAKNNLKDFLVHASGCKTAIIVVIAANVILGFGYLIQTNLTATYGYQIKGLEKELAQLEEENKSLNLDYIRLQSMDKIASSVQTLNLVPVDNLEIINVNDNSLAVARN